MAAIESVWGVWSIKECMVRSIHSENFVHCELNLVASDVAQFWLHKIVGLGSIKRLSYKGLGNPAV